MISAQFKIKNIVSEHILIENNMVQWLLNTVLIKNHNLKIHPPLHFVNETK